MKLIVRHAGIPSAKTLDAMVREKIRELEALRQIDEATVQVTREASMSPPFHVHAHLVTPGPDVFAEARDHTLAAALNKVMHDLAQEIRARGDRRVARLKSNLQAPPARVAAVRG